MAARLLYALLGLQVLVGCATAGRSAPEVRGSIPLDVVYSTSGQPGLAPLNRSRTYVDGTPTYATDHGPALDKIYQNHQKMRDPCIFLVRGENVAEAIGATYDVLWGIRDRDAASALTRESAHDPVWLFFFLGTSGSAPPQWILESVGYEGRNVTVTYRHAPTGAVTRDLHQYLYWAQLEYAEPGLYTLTLQDSTKTEPTVQHVCSVE